MSDRVRVTEPAGPLAPSPEWARPTARRVRAIRERLRLVYGTPSARPHGDPIAELVLTVLSQSTNDRNRDVAYFRLRDRFATWEDVRDAPAACPDRGIDLVEEAIRPGGISKVKSARIRAILAAIAPSGEISLAPLSEMTVPDAQAYLTALPGVGRKTAACVLLFALGMRDVPVDTHVSRVGSRLRLLRPGAGFTEMHDELLALTPRGVELELHMNLLRHGRRTCHARTPACGSCALARMCPSAADLRAVGPARG